MSEQMECHAKSNFWIYFLLYISVFLGTCGTCDMQTNLRSVKSDLNSVESDLANVERTGKDTNYETENIKRLITAMDRKLDDLQSQLDKLGRQKCAPAPRAEKQLNNSFD